ncbi:hypothetical protein DI272_00195 [Streptomyces sp. Act143]|uniref:hypothetical protein n=1 Tax=Streptomyces sp. Act143 TaxID=2200760 RepID=UPI000D673DB8|nr:hypothetical protein [Streptomyces sp. Act143]PWI12755.1 hypothetical protein DI272_00195 [Streptomyces sp. Act143]
MQPEVRNRSDEAAYAMVIRPPLERVSRLLPHLADTVGIPDPGTAQHLVITDPGQKDIAAALRLSVLTTEIALCTLRHRYQADFSAGSLRDVERFMTEHSNTGVAVEDGLLAADLGARLFGVGCYAGETIRLSLGGVWEADDADPAGELNVRLRLASGSVIWPVQRVVKRFQNGPEDSLTAYAVLLGLDVPVD